MKSLWEEIVHDCRSALDAIGVWPNDTVGKAVCAGICMAVVCLIAHYLPFTVEAFFAALLAYGVWLLLFLFLTGVTSGAFAVGMGIYFDLTAEKPSVVEQLRMLRDRERKLADEVALSALPQGAPVEPGTVIAAANTAESEDTGSDAGAS